MKGGNILQFAPPHEIYGKPSCKYVAEFIGAPSMNLLQGNIAGQDFTSEMGTWSLIGYPFDRPQNDGLAWLGIRPEHIASGAAAQTMTLRFDGLIEIIEPLGSDTLARVNAGGQTLWVRLDGQSTAKTGDTLSLGFDPAQSHLFDFSTEQRL